MYKYDIIKRIETFAPLEFAESWDCSGWQVETKKRNVEKVMLCLTVTENVVEQAKNQHCDMIISHHPLFKVPIEWGNIDIYSAHTNLDRTKGGTTDVLISTLGFEDNGEESEFLRYVEVEITLEQLIARLRTVSPNLRYVNNQFVTELSKIAFCSGSGTEFINEAFENGADALVTGDLKFHTALESPIVVFDIGHFESEILVLPVFERLIASQAQVVYAKERSPFLVN